MLDLNKPIKGLDGKQIGEHTLGKALSEQLAFANKGDALKLFNWAQKLYNGESLDLDKSDENVLKDFITNNESFTILVKAQLLELF
jgi:hypothetical protein